MTITRPLTAHPYAQARVIIEDNGTIHLISYATRVITIDSDGWLDCSGTYSNTTRRHIGAFMREYVSLPDGERGNYYMAKAAYEHNYCFNIYTGEVKYI